MEYEQEILKLESKPNDLNTNRKCAMHIEDIVLLTREIIMDALYRFSHGLYSFLLRVITAITITFIIIVAVFGFAIWVAHHYTATGARFNNASPQQEEAPESLVMNE